MSRRRADPDKSVGDASSKCKEAGGAQDSIVHDNNDNEDADVASGNDWDNEDNAKLVLLNREMDSLEYLMYSKGTVSSMISLSATKTSLMTGHAKWPRRPGMGQHLARNARLARLAWPTKRCVQPP